jgi:CBS domain-containing protein
VTTTEQRPVADRMTTVLATPLRTLSRREPLTVPPGTSLRACLRVIKRSGVGDSVLVVTPGGHLVGVLTERDVFGRLVGTDAELDAPVETILTIEPRTLRADQTVRDAMQLMQDGRYRNVPLLDEGGKLAGIVRQADIMRILAESFPQEILNLPPRPHESPRRAEGA